MATYYWRGSTGSFGLPAGWQIAGGTGALTPADAPPTDADVVVLDTTPMTLSSDAMFLGVLQFALPAAAGAFRLGGHTLTLLNSVQLGGMAGVIDGPGLLETDAVTTVADAGAAAPALLLDGGAIWSNSGLVTDAGTVAFGSAGAAMDNNPGALFGLTADGAGLFATTAGAGAIGFNNSGTLAKLAGAGVTSLDVPVANAGVISAETGTLALRAGGVLGGVVGGGDGVVRLAGTFALPLGTSHLVSFAAGAELGAGADGAALLLGPGRLACTGSVAIAAWAGVQVQLENGATWNNGGTVIADGGLREGLAAADTATLVNQAGAWFIFTGDAGIDGDGPASSSVFVNDGTLSKGGGGDSRIAVPLRNPGHIAIDGGTLELAGGATLDGLIDGAGVLAVSAGGTIGTDASIATGGLLVDGGLLVQAGTVALSGAATLAAGAWQLAGGTLTADSVTIGSGAILQGAGAISAAVTAAGSLEATAGTLALAGPLDASGGVQVDAGASLLLDTAADSARTLLVQPGGTLSGSGTLTIGGSAMLGGVQTGSGVTRLLGLATLDDGSTVNAGRTIENDGWLATAGSVALANAATPADGATLSNAGVLALSGGGAIGVAGGVGVVENAGVIAVGGGTGAARIDATLVNSGVVRVNDGTLTLDGTIGGAGIFDIAAMARLDFAAAVAAGASIRFLGGGGTLAIEQAGVFAAAVAGFGAGSVLDLTAVDVASHPVAAYAAHAGGGLLTVGDGVHRVSVPLTGSYAAFGFHVVDDGHGGAAVGYG